MDLSVKVMFLVGGDFCTDHYENRCTRLDPETYLLRVWNKQPPESLLSLYTIILLKLTIASSAMPVPRYLSDSPHEDAPDTLFTNSSLHSFEFLFGISKFVIGILFPGSLHSQKPSTVPLSRFIVETIRRSRSSKPVVVVALLLLVRSGVTGTRCGHREFLASLLVSSKFLNDRNYSNAAWSKISGLSVSEINCLERDFCESLKWRVFVGVEEYEQWQRVFSWKREEFARWIMRCRNTAMSVVSCGIKRKRKEVTTPRKYVKVA